ncbi:MAG TPA: hypothetical protein VFK02_21335 [Kofleriaceae bacterium]|nr:hypothetical protein [Kofleriaceae bacterium]
MSGFAKMAVTVPAATYEAVERVRRRLGKSRSAAVAIALHEWLRGMETSDADRRYIEAYGRQPERVDEVRAIAAQATAHWEPWEAAEVPRGGRAHVRAPRKRPRAGSPRRRAPR